MSRPIRIAATALVVVAFAAIAQYGFFYYRDNFATHYPMKVISAHAFRSFEIPWWNFQDIGGQPLAGNPNALTFYPDNILYLFLPAHVAFNLHFLLHLAAGFVAMRALCLAKGIDARSALFGATVWAISGVAISSTALYNLVTAIALVPFALYAVERSSARLLGLAMGMLLLAAEPVTLIGTTIAVAIIGIGRMPLRSLAAAALIAAAIGSPQIIAFSEIAGEVERVVPMRMTSVLGASLSPKRVLEIFTWPLSGFLNDAGGNKQRLFSTVFLGVIAIPALWSRSRYTAVAIVLLLLALGIYNPVLPPLFEHFPSFRVMRYPEKFAIPLEAALVVLIAAFFSKTSWKRHWAAITLVPLVWCAIRTIPIDWFSYYRVTPQPPIRVPAFNYEPKGVPPQREVFRQRARNLEWLFGAVAGLRYGVGRSPDRMHSLLSRTVAERYEVVPPPLKQRYLRISGCDVSGHLPDAMIVPAIFGAHNIVEAVQIVESSRFDEHRWAVGPAPLHGFVSARGHIMRYAEKGQTIEIDVVAKGPVVVFVNQSFFESWVARAGDRELTTLPLDVDRLGVLVPKGVRSFTLTFGRYRRAVEGTWIASSLLILVLLGAKRIEKLDRRSREIERTGDEDRPLV